FDAGDTAVFTLVSGAGDTDNASFVIAGVELQTAASFDYETKSSYSLRVRATDGLGLTYEQVFTVNVLNVNEAPAGIDLDNIFIAENEPSGTVVGALASSDADAGDTVTYTLVSGEGDADNGSFTIVNGTNLATTAAFDYETQDVFTLRVRATDGGGLFTEVQFFILVEDLIEAPTNILLSNASVAENQAAGALVGILSAVDQDIGDTAAFTFVSGTGGDDNGSFSIVGGTNLVTAATFDYEAKNSYSVRVRVTDSGDLAFEKAFTIAISDVNDAPTDISLSASSVTENAAIGTTVGTFAAADVDAGDTATFTFVSGGGGDDNAAFSIAGAALQTAAAFDYEVKNSYSVRVRVTDGGGLSFEKQFTITVTNANEAPTDISLSAGSVAENSASGTTVGTLSGTDVDAGDTAAFTLVSGAGDTDNAAFSIVGTALKTAAVFNYEAKSSYTVRVRVADGGGLSFEKQFTVSVTDVNDAPTNLTLGHASVAENEPAGALVGALAASDADSGASATFTLVPGAGSQDNESFSVVNGTNLVTADTFDFEFRDSYSLRVRATDNGGLYFERVLTIAVTDVNETPLDIELTSTSVAENAAPGTVVGVLASVEYDFVDTAVFALVSGDGDADNALFSISDGTNLVTAAVFDFEATNSYSLRVRVTDSATNVFERQFTVTVLDVNEFTLTNQTVALIEDTGAQQIILGSSVASGATYLVLGGPAHGTVSVFGNIATYTAFNNFQGLDTFTYILSNALGTSTVATVTVNVANVLDILPYAFSNAVDYAVGLAPAAIVAGKFYKGNDLAVANYSNNTVSILLNSGKGYFTNAVPPTVAVGNGPVALATANFNSHTNKDTKPDLVVAHQLDETLQVLLGDGLGGFTNLAPLALDHRPSALAAGDLNKDTRADVVLANGDDETITVLLGLGDGTFGDDTHYIVGTNPVAVVVADFNKDMKADVATANYGENTVSILWGVGTGALSNAVHYAVGANPNALAVGDFNKDGRSDLVVANYGDDTISVLLSVRQTNSGVRTNTFTRTDYPVGINPSAVIVTNINKDAYQDIIVAGYYENTVQVLLGRTNGVFEPYYNDPSATEPVGTNPIALAVGNFNADTDLDVAVANWGSGNVSILLNNYTPVAYAQKLNVVEDTATPITLTATFGPLNYLILSGPTNGSFILTNGAMSNATANPVLTYLPATNANGKDLITFKVQDDGGKTSKVVKLEIVILPVNDAPSFSLASNAIELAEDSLKRSITNFAINLDRGADGHATEAKQMLFFVVTNSASNLFKAQPAMTLAGTNTLLTFEPAKNAHGEATVGVFLKDKSGTASGGVDTSAQAFFTLTITNVNDTPVLFNWPAAFPTVKTNSSTNITFAVWDADTGTNGLFYSVNWTNTVLFPDAALKGDLAAFASTNFAFGTVGTNRTLTIYPAFGQKGTDKLIVTIYDGTNSVSKTNAVTVK
ncbi:MAG: cadherin domain-containing protein, partial [Verrucomicrobia bacterium]|nr:cadherin domain-containing protein [Verrucomicrobiota bacterium]